MDSRNPPVGDTRPSYVTTWLTLAFAGAALCALCLAFAHTDRTLAMRPRLLILFFSAFAAFLIAVLAVSRVSPRCSPFVGQELRLLPETPYDLPPRLVWLIVLVGIALRLAVAPIRPATTSDIYRYLWEGSVVRAGMNPYADAPDSPRLRHLRDWTWPLVTFKSVPVAYPPVAQYVFAAAGLVPGPPVIVLKLVLALFDVGTVLLLVSILSAMNLPRSSVILYAWHPLAICELVARGHLDTIGIFFMALALRLFGRSLLLPLVPGSRPPVVQSILSAAALALSILAKGYALVIAPFFVLAARPRRWGFVLATVATAALAYAPFASAGLGLFRGAAMYGRGWSGNSSIFALLDLALSHLSPSHDTIARAICLLAALLWIGLLLKRARAERGLAPACPERLVPHSLGEGGSRRAVSVPVPAPGSASFALLALIGFFLLSPTVYPWYLAWTLPWLCLDIAATRRAGACLLPQLPWLILTGTIFGFYAHDLAGHHREIWWVTTAEYGLPLLAALVCLNGDWLRISRRRSSHTPAPT